jgi:hypothetical protein
MLQREQQEYELMNVDKARYSSGCERRDQQSLCILYVNLKTVVARSPASLSQVLSLEKYGLNLILHIVTAV